MLAASIVETNILQDTFKQGLNALGLILSDEQQADLLAYLALLSKWNQVYNLTAIRDPQQMLTHHLLDTLAVIPLLKAWLSPSPLRILDVGSGAGLPGIPWAIACPEWQLTLVDTVKKKTAFLEQAKNHLKINNLNVVSGRIEALSETQLGGSFHVLTCRAFASLTQFIGLAGSWLLPDGVAIALKGEYPEQELRELPSTWQAQKIHSLTIPGLDAQRHVVLLSRTTN